ncbi:MAG: C_GCAxxG_C_C family protein [Clostridia bacterium]|nr:C_GCAxxG_C_C family protein [Clostridia bacterium]
MKNSEKAVNLFTKGYNCAQAVFGAFAKELGFDEATALKMAAPFGGGIGRQREVCGAVSGMLMVFGYLYGYETPETGEIKMHHYEQTRALCDAFKKQNGSIICRDILKTDEVGGTPAARTEQYYHERPCVRCVRTASEILEEYIKNQKGL